jgi:dihydrofolate reductase
MRLSIIAALSTNNVIGRSNDIPWRQSTDLKRLKAMTMGHHMILGRKTWDTLGKPLPGRTMVVITRQDNVAPVYHDSLLSLHAFRFIKRELNIVTN